MRSVDSRTCLPSRAAQERLSILILLIPHILADRKCQALGGLHHADNRLACFQGKPYVGLRAGCWWLSRYAMPEHHHGDHIQREQTPHQQDTGMHRRSPSAMMTLSRARQHRPASSAHLPVADVQGDFAAMHAQGNGSPTKQEPPVGSSAGSRVSGTLVWSASLHARG